MKVIAWVLIPLLLVAGGVAMFVLDLPVAASVAGGSALAAVFYVLSMRVPPRLVERPVHGRFAEWMRARHWSGVTLPLPFVTVIFYWMAAGELTVEPTFRTHERRHAFQADRWGWLGFWARYLWGMRKGYRMNPLEVEARKAAGQE